MWSMELDDSRAADNQRIQQQIRRQRSLYLTLYSLFVGVDDVTQATYFEWTETALSDEHSLRMSGAAALAHQKYRYCRTAMWGIGVPYHKRLLSI